MADLLSVAQIAELKEAFAIFDKDSDGIINVSDVADVFRAVGQNVAAEDLQEMVGQADLDANGVVDFPEFLNLVAIHMYDVGESEGELRATFQQFDLGQTGFISAANMQCAMAKLGCRLSVEEADEMVREADTDGDGRLSYAEFRRVMLSGT